MSDIANTHGLVMFGIAARTVSTPASYGVERQTPVLQLHRRPSLPCCAASHRSTALAREAAKQLHLPRTLDPKELEPVTGAEDGTWAACAGLR